MKLVVRFRFALAIRGHAVYPGGSMPKV